MDEAGDVNVLGQGALAEDGVREHGQLAVLGRDRPMALDPSSPERGDPAARSSAARDHGRSRPWSAQPT